MNIKKFFWDCFTNYKKLIKIEVEYELITQAGNVILTINEEIKPIKPFIVKNKWDDFLDYNKSIEDNKEYKKIFDTRAEEILNDYQKQERKHLKDGWLDSGNYIVKCIWDIYLKFEYAEYEEVKNGI